MNFLVDMNLTPSWVTPDAWGGSVLAAIHQAKVELAAGPSSPSMPKRRGGAFYRSKAGNITVIGRRGDPP